ncbi:hypothetical protein [Nostoc sp. MG11]|uniref:hypothetical protein n=1 Tax=Nostoc sp. MG11 TaxID=2721166 RepID=UPI001866647E|nr:hypothetical protein [Nostoc sp. MG11]
MQIYRPDGTRFSSYVEICQLLEQERQRAEQAEAALEAQRKRSQLLAERLRVMGVNPEELM